jgi:hypothetical protein
MGLMVEKTAATTLAVSAGQPALFVYRRSPRTRYAGNHEPDLADMLTDPIMHRLLASDGVRSDHLIDLIADVKVKLRQSRYA